MILVVRRQFYFEWFCGCNLLVDEQFLKRAREGVPKKGDRIVSSELNPSDHYVIKVIVTRFVTY